MAAGCGARGASESGGLAPPPPGVRQPAAPPAAPRLAAPLAALARPRGAWLRRPSWVGLLTPLAEGGAELVRRGRGGADLGDDEAGGVVGEHGRLLEGPAGAERQGAGGDDRVAGPGDVEGLARQGGKLPHGHPTSRGPLEQG